MSSTPPARSLWATSSLGCHAHVPSLENGVLSNHLAQCSSQRGLFQALLTSANGVLGLLAGHAITSAVVLTLLVSGLWL